MYDEYPMRTAFDLRTESEIMHINLKDFRVAYDDKNQRQKMPIGNHMNLTENGYLDYLQDLAFSMREFKRWLDDVILRGD